jgi:hypothetical protein
MAKDPAFLFYSADFIVGTYEMTDEQVGRYIRLMCLQHQKGHLSESVVLSVMGGEIDKEVIGKLKRDDDGLYYNERLDEEMSKRRKYSESRAKNRKEGAVSKSHDNHMSNICNSYDEHMVNENENVNVNETDKKIVKVKHKHGEYNNVLLSDDDLEKLKAEFTDWEERIERLSEYIESKGAKYKNHFVTIKAWARKDGNTQQPVRKIKVLSD